MGSTAEQIVDQVAVALKEVCDRRIKEMEESYQRIVIELETYIRHRDRRIMDIQEVLTMRDASVKSLMTILKECHAAMDQTQNDKKVLQRQMQVKITNALVENELLERRVAELEQRPEPMPCGIPELTRAALDQVRKWDSDARVDEQRKTIWHLSRDVKHNNKEIARLEEEVESANKTIENMRMGHGLQMNEVWMGMFEEFERSPMTYWPWHYSTRSLHDFLWHLGNDFLKKDHEDHEARQEEDEDDEDDGDE